MPEETEEIIYHLRKNLDLVKKRRVTASLALATVANSNVCVELFNHTAEANVFNICRQSAYLRCILETRKILEPYKKDKTANLDYIIKQTYKYKEYFAQEHYNRMLAIDVYCEGEINPKDSPSYNDFIQSKANDEKIRCLQKIELLKHRWDVFWFLLGEREAFAFVRETRDMLVHSMNVTTIYMPPISKMKKIINLIRWFIKKLDYIVNDLYSDYSGLDNQTEQITSKFWSRMK